MSLDSVLNKIRRLWGTHTDFEDGGFEYVAFVISNDISDMEESGFSQESCEKEFADIAINSLRALDELSDEEVHDLIHRRLDTRMDGETAKIIEKYQTLYQEEEGSK